MRSCHWCGRTDRDLRPYGPGGSMVCRPCATSTPEREQAAREAMEALIGAAEAVSPYGVAVLGQEIGPVPFDPTTYPRCECCASKADICIECRACLRCVGHEVVCSQFGTQYEPERGNSHA